MGACGSGGVPFELWRRFYYPNIRDQLVAKVRNIACSTNSVIHTASDDSCGGGLGRRLKATYVPLSLVTEPCTWHEE